ncbi:MAG: hypothetical protein V4534_07165 [Myxococcota bacterium]
MAKYPVEDIRQNLQVRTYLDNHKVYLSLTTSPQRLAKLPLVLQGLDLTHIEAVLLALPAKYKNQEEYVIPEAVSSLPKLKILERRAHDLGPIMKLVPAVEYVLSLGDPKALVLTIDDDVAHAKGTFGQLIKGSVLRGGVVASNGYSAGHFGLSKQEWVESFALAPSVNLIEGYAGVAYPVGQVDTARMIQLSQVSKNCKTSDDLVISWVLAESRVPRSMIKNVYIPGGRPFQFGLKSDALHAIASNDSRYQDCAKTLVKWIPGSVRE